MAESSMAVLTKKQSEAASHFEGPAIVVAGPGSGKTRVLTERIRFLIAQKFVDPASILATTFTEKAAAEISNRLFRTTGKAAQHVHVSTVHSLCMTMLQDYFSAHGLGARFSVMDADGQKLFILAHRSKLNLGGRRGWRDLVFTSAGYLRNYEDTVAGLYNLLTENEINAQRLTEDLRAQGLLTHDMERILESYTIYRDLLQEDKQVDFAHLQTIALRMLRNNPEVAKQVQQRFRFVLVDEYQDTSPIQDEIFRIIAEGHRNIFVVGDENQSIYGFRGASIENFTRFTERYPGASEYFLNTNFRSVHNIVEIANKIFEDKLKEKLEAYRGKGNEIVVIGGESRKGAALNAVQFLKGRISEGKLHAKDIAFLYRKKSLADDAIWALSQEEIDYQTDSDGRFLEREEIESVVNLFGYLYQEEVGDLELAQWNEWWEPGIFDNSVMALDKITISAIAALPRDFAISRILTEDQAREVGIAFREDQRKIIALNELRAQTAAKGMGLLEALYEIFRLTRVISRLLFDEARSQENEEKLFNLAHLTRLLADYERSFARPSAKGFLYLLYNRGRQKSLNQVVAERPDAVKCMTVHKAKGLEFPAVVICSLVEGDFPLRSRDEKRVCGIPIPDRYLRRPPDSRSEAAHYAEELRLFYVALTRAQDLVILTRPRKVPGRHVEESRFLSLIRDYITDRIDGSITIEREYQPPRDVPVLSYSSVQAYLDCPFQYLLSYHYRFTTPSSPMERQGVVVHNVVQTINLALKEGKMPDEAEIREIVDRSWLPIGGKKADERIKERIVKQSIQYCKFAIESFSKILQVESPFTFVDDNMIVRGRADLIARDKSGKNVLIDFKARTAKGIEPTGVRRQLGLYRHSLDTVSIGRTAAYAFWDNQLIDFETNEDEIQRDLERVSVGAQLDQLSQMSPPGSCPCSTDDGCFFRFVCDASPGGQT
jgi:DNA helicase-2/ATP-dependent DNA helicase PcrA